eukprot:304293-Rhodomonas_salina.1
MKEQRYCKDRTADRQGFRRLIAALLSHTPQTPTQESAFLAQVVLNLRFLAAGFGVYPMTFSIKAALTSVVSTTIAAVISKTWCALRQYRTPRSERVGLQGRATRSLYVLSFTLSRSSLSLVQNRAGFSTRQCIARA